MEFTARTVTHPDGSIEKEAALTQLKAHPQFKPGTVIINFEKRAGRWVAQLHEPKVAAPNPFGESDGPPSSDDSSAPSEPKEDAPKEESDGDSKEDKSESKDTEKVDLHSIMDLVQQIAAAVGVPAPGPEGDSPHDPLAPEGDGPPLPPEGGVPPHDETSPVPGDPNTKQIIHRKAPPGATPVGSPAFASTKQASPKVASFDVEEPFDGSVREAKEEIESLYGPYGYKVKKIREAKTEDGKRVIQARVSVR
jgi:hypothetical protein